MKTNAERQRKWREKQLGDPILKQKLQMKERLKNEKRKQQGKTKLIHELDPASQRALRKHWAKSKQKQRGKAVDAQASSMTTSRSRRSKRLGQKGNENICTLSEDETNNAVDETMDSTEVEVMPDIHNYLNESNNTQHLNFHDSNGYPNFNSDAFDYNDYFNDHESNDNNETNYIPPALTNCVNSDHFESRSEVIEDQSNSNLEQEQTPYSSMNYLSCSLTSPLKNLQSNLEQQEKMDEDGATNCFLSSSPGRHYTQNLESNFSPQNKSSPTIMSTLPRSPMNSSRRVKTGARKGTIEDKENHHPRASKRAKKMNENVKRFLATGGKRKKQKVCDKQPAPICDQPSLLDKVTVACEPSPIIPQHKRPSEKAKLAKVYRVNTKLRKENKRLRRLAEMYRKRWTRAVRKLNERENTPVAKVKKFISNRRIPKDIESKLVEHEVLEQQLTEKYKSLQRHRDKDILRRIFLSGKIARKYRKISYFKQFCPKRTSKDTSSSNMQYKRKPPSARSINIKKDVVAFLERDCNSRMTAGVKETVTRHKVKKQKRFLSESLETLHIEFLKTVPYKISYSSFCKLRPFWILFPNVDDRDTCACKTHDNMSLLVTKLFHENVLEEQSSSKLLAHLTCDIKKEKCMLRECTDCMGNPLPLTPFDQTKKITYFRWETVNHTYEEVKKSADGKDSRVTKTVKRMVKHEKSATIQEVLDVLKNDLPKYMKHVFFMSHQYSTLYTKRTELKTNEVFMHFDWSQNWLTKMAKEIQTVHFGGSRQQISLHTGVGYEQASTQCFCTVSECCDHGPANIMAHIKPVVEIMLAKLPCDDHHVHFQSDSPTTQYRGKEMFAYLVECFPHVFPSVKSFTWNYTEAGHGKGSVDGVGAGVKLVADKQVAHGNDMDTFEKFVACTSKIENISMIVIIDKDVENIKEHTIHPMTFKGTNSVHQLTWSRSNPHTLQFNYLSCFECSPGTKCCHYHLGILDYSPRPESQADEEMVDDIPVSSSTDAVTPQVSIQEQAKIPESNIKKNDWVALTLSGRLYPGMVKSCSGDKVSVRVMMRVGEEEHHYGWPSRDDVRKVGRSAVQRLAETPQQFSQSPQIYKVIF